MINTLFTTLGIKHNGLISIVGGGGKTSLMYTLANEFVSVGKKVIVTTTTHIMMPKQNEVEEIILSPNEKIVKQMLDKYNLVAVGEYEGKKLSSPNMNFFDYAQKYADYIIVEADGAKMLPFKAPKEGEPIIPKNTKYIIAVAGLSAIGYPIENKCHRDFLVSDILGKAKSEILTPDDMATVLTSKKGQLKNVEDISKYMIVLNQADTQQDIDNGILVAKKVYQNINVKCLLTTLRDKQKIKLIYEEGV